jgi:predicted RecA/RadA family phage recombinase
MATNLYMNDGRYITGAATQPATPVSGDPVLLGQIPGVALTDEAEGGNASGQITIDTGGVYNLSVEGVNNGGNSAVAIGDIIYYEAGEDPPLNKDATSGVRFGYALGTVGSGQTATIPVKVGY